MAKPDSNQPVWSPALALEGRLGWFGDRMKRPFHTGHAAWGWGWGAQGRPACSRGQVALASV